MPDQIGVYDHAIGENVITEMTAEEQAKRDQEVADYHAKEAAKQAEEKAKATAKADLLARLGITAEEAALLLG